jgi:hypothetical protein
LNESERINGIEKIWILPFSNPTRASKNGNGQ